MTEKRGRSNKQKENHPVALLVKAGVLVSLTLVLCACGLNRLVYLYPINRDRVVPITGGYRFYHNTDNDTLTGVFVGYDIFYKFYSDDAQTDASITEDRAYFYGLYIPSEGTITSRGFQPFRRNAGTGLASGQDTSLASSRTPPFLPWGGGPGTYEINFLSSAHPAYVVANPATHEASMLINPPPAPAVPADYLTLYRTPRIYQSITLKSFDPTKPNSTDPNSGFASGDPDTLRLPASFNTTGSKIYVGVCVVAYGWDPQNNFSRVYSEAVILNTRVLDTAAITF
ncbi:MAG: hypothetical protein LBC67_07020 [Spirochaetales bacterium]|jgi:hypothetical protein|nr:hypothetical protein [Spirochaetales bacterium]